MIFLGSHGWKCDLKLLLSLLTLVSQQVLKFPSGEREDGRGDQRSHGSSTEQGGANPCSEWQMSHWDKGRWDEVPLSVSFALA